MSQAIALSPNAKILLDALAALQQLPASTVVNKALFAYRGSLDPEDRDTLDLFCGRAAHHREKSQRNGTRSSAGRPKVTYESSRFCFKREPIEGLEPAEQFRMITPVGVFQMSKADFYREFPNVVASRSYQRGVYNYPQLPSRAEQFRLRETTILDIKREFDPRIRVLVQRWREACVAAGWPTTEMETGFEELSPKHPVHTWWIDAALPLDSMARIIIYLEGETDAGEDGGLFSVVNCFVSISLGPMGSDHVRWDAPRINVLLDDSQAFEEKFQALEQVDDGKVVSVINRHLRNPK